MKVSLIVLLALASLALNACKTTDSQYTDPQKALEFGQCVAACHQKVYGTSVDAPVEETP